jgi:hypothetical protein
MPSPAITFIWLAFAVIGAIIGSRKGRLAMGIVWSLLLGPIGLIIVAVTPKTEAQQVKDAAQQARVRQLAEQQAHRGG